MAILYALFATLWIFFSDTLVELLVPPGSFRLVQSIKGVLFVAATTLVLLAALRRAFGTIEASNEKLRVEEKIIRESLAKEKELLLELHHRVKNNLQLINSLLSIQSGMSTDAAPNSELRRARERILSVTLAHKLAYREGQTETVEISPFLKELTEELRLNENRLGEGAEFETDLQDLILEITRAVPLGIIAQELITNAERHAFRSRAAGRIRLILRLTDDEILLAVEDNGGGIPAESLEEGTGFLILRTLVEQLNGELSVTFEAGTRVEVRFPRFSPADSPV